MRKVRRIAENVIIFCLICILGISLYNIGQRTQAYRKSVQVYESIPTKDFEELAEINPDVVAWIENEAINVDYPIVQGDDNNTYLNLMFNGEWGGSGCLFVDYICEEPFKQFNTVVYGHHMLDGTMFAQLQKYKKKEFAEKNPTFKLYTPDETYTLAVCAFLNPSSLSEVYATNLLSEEREQYIQIINDEALYTIGEISTSDRLVLLSTCAYEYSGARYVVVCKMKPYVPKVIDEYEEEVELPESIYDWHVMR